jgi:hypothetical protein
MFLGSLGGDVNLFDLLAQCVSPLFLALLVFVAASALVVAACSMIRYLNCSDATGLCGSQHRASTGNFSGRSTGR